MLISTIRMQNKYSLATKTMENSSKQFKPMNPDVACLPPPETAFIDALETLLSEDEDRFEQKLEALVLSFSGNFVEGVNKPNYISMVRNILIACPAFAMIPRASDGVLPLHIAASIGDVQLGFVIATAHPSASVAQSFKGKTPLHVAAREGHIDFVGMLLFLNPFAAQISSKKLKLPLHFAAMEGQTEICRRLLQAFPDGAATRSTKGKSPLHLASRRGSLETMEELLSVYPAGATLPDWEESTPLSIAVREGQDDAALYLIKKYPDALQIRNINGELPIDIVLRSNSSFTLFSAIVERWPEGCKYLLKKIGAKENAEDLEWTKLELCIRTVSNLQEKSFDVGGRKRSRGCDVFLTSSAKPLCLHTLLELTSNSSLLRLAMKMYEDDTYEKDRFGRLPVHVAAKYCKDNAILEDLLKLHPKAAFKRDNFGRLPLHVALLNSPNLRRVQMLLKFNKKSAVEKCNLMINNMHYEEPPLLLAATQGCSTDIIYTLARCDPTLVQSSSEII
mmetsp:Transcript_24773/g.30461  ORF Transcript_24773/g.30461 Transcript_24773/m.30461 type:complete len:507 (-) Transcript_24773:712-2232(-)